MDNKKIEISENENKFIVIFKYKGLTGIYYRTFPLPEELVLEDLQLSSRLKSKGKSLGERLIEKSNSITNSYLENIIDGDKIKLDSFFKETNKVREVRNTLYQITANLGHRNVSEQANFMVSLSLPILAALVIQDEKFLASQERSTRYVEFNDYYLPENSDNSLTLYYNLISSLYDKTFSYFINEKIKSFKISQGREPSKEEIETVIIPTVRDLVRGFIGLGAITTLVLNLNGRTAENIARKLLSNENYYVREVGNLFTEMVNYAVPSLSTHLLPDDFSRKVLSERISFNDDYIDSKPKFSKFEDVEVKILAGSQSEEQIIESIYSQLPSSFKKEGVISYLKNISKERKGKFDEYNDGILRNSFVQFQITSSLGSARDLWRHRLAEKNIEVFTNHYFIPKEIYDNKDLFEEVNYKFSELNDYYKKLLKEKSSLSRLIIPLAVESKLTMSMSLAEAIFIIENRSTSEGHPEYKQIAMKMYEELNRKYPNLMNSLKIFIGNSGASSSEYSRTYKPNTSFANEHLF
ncbi:MAG: FAD-dependent thymidylate synthase [Candidatus Rehaiarchaeum fermentans]|nr:FAD-dependent thymidylate synthase [Candidatus Rehaiarchaeum fermentans]